MRTWEVIGALLVGALSFTLVAADSIYWFWLYIAFVVMAIGAIIVARFRNRD
jgi:predicted ABC-type sugar transport system permease subunit